MSVHICLGCTLGPGVGEARRRFCRCRRSPPRRRRGVRGGPTAAMRSGRAVISHGTQAPLTAAHCLETPLSVSAGQEDDAAGDADGQKDVGAPGINRRLAWLLQELAGSAAVDLGRRTALQRRLLAAFRAGQLGRYTLDEV